MTREKPQLNPFPALHYLKSHEKHMTLHLNWEILFFELISDGNQFLKHNTGTRNTEVKIIEVRGDTYCPVLILISITEDANVSELPVK